MYLIHYYWINASHGTTLLDVHCTCKCVHSLSHKRIHTYIHTHCTIVAKNKTSKRSKKKQAAHSVALLTPDHTHLTFGYHKAIVAALALLPCLSVDASAAPSDQSESVKGANGARRTTCGGEEVISHQMNVLVVGLGGGALPMFINKCIPNVS